jgi:hypothetical protein
MQTDVCRIHTGRNLKQRTSPTAMFAELEWQAGLRTHEHMIIMQTNRLPTSRTQWLLDSPLLVYRCGGSAGFGLT